MRLRRSEFAEREALGSFRHSARLSQFFFPSDLLCPQDDEDEEEEGEKRRKVDRPNDFSRFLDIEAEAVDEDDEDEGEQEEGFEELVAEATDGVGGAATSGAHHRLMNSIKEIEEAGVNEQALEKRFEYYTAGEDQGLVATEHVPTQGLQPSLLDPKMWMVKTKPGKEKEAVMHMMNRYFLKRELGESMGIYSVVAPEHTKGFIFVEADKEPNVRAAIHGVPNVFSFNTMLVPMAQMTSVLRVSTQNVDLQQGAWVRIKRGLYQGDIGQVVEADTTTGSRFEIKLLPRLTMGLDDDTAQQAATGKGTKRKKKVDLNTRPAARAFNAEELHEMGQRLETEVLEQGRTVYYYQGEAFQDDGYMYKWMSVKSLETQNVRPTLDELQLFYHSGARDADSKTGEGKDVDETPEDKLVRLARIAKDRAVPVRYAKGDVVKVVTGGEKGVIGTVKDVNGNTVTVILKPVDAKQPAIVEQYLAEDLEKHFEVGDHVLILNGTYKGHTGLISNVDLHAVSVVDDSSLETCKVLKADIQKSVSVATGQLKLGNYSLHDMVRVLPGRNVGVIVKIEQDALRILDQNGSLLTVQLAAMGPKVHTRDPVSFDKMHQHVTEGDLLKVVEGPFRGKQGRVVHLYRFFAFLECREVLANSGIINVKTDHCVLLGAQVRKKRENPYAATAAMALMSPSLNPLQQSAGNVAQVTKVYQKSKQKDQLVGKRGKIVKGKYRAYIGIVRNATEDKLQVELEATRRTVQIGRNEFEPEGGRTGPHSGPFPPMQTGQAPLGGFGDEWDSFAGKNQTPIRPNTPQTPMHGEHEDELWDPSRATPVHQPTQWTVGDDDYGSGAGGGGGASSVGGGSSQGGHGSEAGWTPSTLGSGYGSGSAYQSNTYAPFNARVNSPAAAPTPGSGPQAPTPGGHYNAAGQYQYGASPSPFLVQSPALVTPWP
jgi:transcription elongation factor SPT5